MPLAVALMGYAATLMLEPAAEAVSNSFRRIIHKLQALHSVVFTPSCAAAGHNLAKRTLLRTSPQLGSGGKGSTVDPAGLGDARAYDQSG